MNGYGSPEVRIVVSIPRYRAMVHYLDCPWYTRSFHRHLPLPRTMKVKLCSWCRPSEEDVRAQPPEVSWYPFSPCPGPKLIVVPMAEEAIENSHARRELGHGRTPSRSISAQTDWHEEKRTWAS